MKPNRTLIAAFYTLSAFLVVGSVLQALLPVWPPRPGDIQWRFALAGVLSRSILPGLMGTALAIVLALTLAHTRALRALSVLLALAALLLFGLTGLFVLDALTLRNSVRPDAARAFDLATLHAFVTLVVCAALLALLAIGGWRMRSVRRPAPALVGAASRMQRPDDA